MGSVGCDGEFQLSSSIGKKHKFPGKFRDECGVVPRKLRSAIKKRGHESITPLSPISRKLNRVSNGVDLRRKDGSKKSKMKMKQEHVTKDEEEVAETLYALASMVPDTTKKKKLRLDGETSEPKSSSLQPAVKHAISTPQEVSKRISTRVIVDAALCSSDLTESTVQVVKFHSSGDAKQPDLPFNEDSSTSGVSGAQLEPSLVPMLKMPTLDSSPSGELPITLEQVGIQNGTHRTFTENKINDSSLLPGSAPMGALSSQTQGFHLQSSTTKLPAWLDQTNYATQPRSCKKSGTDEKLMSQDSQVLLESKKSWKKRPAHVYIARLIKALQITERKDGLQEKPTHLSWNEGLNLGSRVSVNSQTNARNGSNCVATFNNIGHSAAENSTEIQNAILLYKRLLQGQEHGSTIPGSCTLQKQDSDFLSLAAGVCDVDSNDGINRTGHSNEALKQFHGPYMQPQNESAMLSSLPRNGYSSTFPGRLSTSAAQQIQIAPYLSSTLGGPSHLDATFPVLQRSESDEQQKWIAQIPTEYHPGFTSPHFPDWQKGGRDTSSLLNNTQGMFPHFQYKGISPPQQQQQIVACNSSVPPSYVRRHYTLPPPGFKRNGAAFHPDSLQQLQLLCNQHR